LFLNHPVALGIVSSMGVVSSTFWVDRWGAMLISQLRGAETTRNGKKNWKNWGFRRYVLYDYIKIMTYLSKNSFAQFMTYTGPGHAHHVLTFSL